MRYLRVLVAALAFFVAPPAMAAPFVVDDVVAVAETDETHEADDEADPPSPPRVHHGPRLTTNAPALDALVLVPHKYLRHCALLC